MNYLERQKNVLQQRIQEDSDIIRSLNKIIAKEKSALQILEAGNFAVEEKTFETLHIAGIRMKGKYPDIRATRMPVRHALHTLSQPRNARAA